jgi:hypothetical protein
VEPKFAACIAAAFNYWLSVYGKSVNASCKAAEGARGRNAKNRAESSTLQNGV